MSRETRITQWGCFEAVYEGPQDGNPFVDVSFSATFTAGGRKLLSRGFYDGEGRYLIRMTPDMPGEWTYVTHSNIPALDGKEGTFHCDPAQEGVHGPVVVQSTGGKAPRPQGMPAATRFAYADGTPYVPVGTTCYVWNLQTDELEEQTLRTLAGAPFNKIRMCVFPKHYDYNHNEPRCYPFEGNLEAGFDFTRPNPAYFRHLEMRIRQLGELGIEADLILFHPYDRWGFSSMGLDSDLHYLRYAVARLSSLRNVWWSLANEYDLMKAKSMTDWDAFFRVIAQEDYAAHLRSIHHCTVPYDHTKPWATHASMQTSELHRVCEWIDAYRKPVIVDECCYEGDISWPWGNITAEELVNRMWMGYTRGGYVTHGETYLSEDEILWWAKGGTLKGQSPARIAFLREVLEAIPGVPEVARTDYNQPGGLQVGKDYFLHYYDIRQQRVKRLSLPEDRAYRVETIDAWDCTVTPLEGTYSGTCEVPMPGKPYCGLRITAVE